MRYEKDYSDHYVVAYYRNKAARERWKKIKAIIYIIASITVLFLHTLNII